MPLRPEQIDFTEIILKGSRELGIPVTREASLKMLRYFHLLQEWNRKVNLTSLRDPLEIALLHFLDSLTAFRVLERGTRMRVLDMGTGAGFPGMVIRIADESLKMSLLDRDPRKIVFLKHVASDLGLSELTYFNAPLRSLVESQPSVFFDAVVSRAFASDPAVWDSVSVLLEPSGSLVRMAGPASGGADFVLQNFVLSEVWEGILPFSTVHRRVILYKKT